MDSNSLEVCLILEGKSRHTHVPLCKKYRFDPCCEAPYILLVREDYPDEYLVACAQHEQDNYLNMGWKVYAG